MSGLFSRACRSLGNAEKLSGLQAEAANLREVLVERYRNVAITLEGAFGKTRCGRVKGTIITVTLSGWYKSDCLFLSVTPNGVQVASLQFWTTCGSGRRKRRPWQRHCSPSWQRHVEPSTAFLPMWLLWRWEHLPSGWVRYIRKEHFLVLFPFLSIGHPDTRLLSGRPTQWQ